MRALFFLSLIFMESIYASTSLDVESEGMKLRVREIYRFKDVPWGMASIGPNEILVNLKAGKMMKLNLETLLVQEVSGLPKVDVQGQGGLMDVKTHPQFASNGLIYFTFSKKNSEDSWTTALARAKLVATRLQDLNLLFEGKLDSDERVHFGSRISFDAAGNLYFGIGDRGQREKAQDLRVHQGKVIRLTLEGKVPADNPFVGRPNALPEIWSYGHRNPQGTATHPVTGEVWINEHGPRGGDEINLVKRGQNYGWPVITFGREYWGPKIGEGTEKAGMEQPVHQFTPSIAPSSLLIYSGKLFKAWEGDFFSGALVLQHVNRLVLKDQKVIREERLLTNLGERIRHLIELPNGEILLSADSGKLFRIQKLP